MSIRPKRPDANAVFDEMVKCFKNNKALQNTFSSVLYHKDAFNSDGSFKHPDWIMIQNLPSKSMNGTSFNYYGPVKPVLKYLEYYEAYGRLNSYSNEEFDRTEEGILEFMEEAESDFVKMDDQRIGLILKNPSLKALLGGFGQEYFPCNCHSIKKAEQDSLLVFFNGVSSKGREIIDGRGKDCYKCRYNNGRYVYKDAARIWQPCDFFFGVTDHERLKKFFENHTDEKYKSIEVELK